MNLFCSETKNLAKQDILFIHGNLASTAWWRPTEDAWKKLGPVGTGSLLFADWRGCGQNADWPKDEPFTLKQLAEDFLEMLRHQGRTELALVGHSLGGLIALQMMILDPRRFSRAVLLDPVGAKGVVFDDSMYEAFRQMSASKDLTQMVIQSTIRHVDKLDSKLKAQLTEDAFKAVKGIGTSVLEILKTVNLEAEAQQIKVPTLILHGAHDQVIPLADSQQLQKLMKNAKFELLPDAGHCWNVENPTAFVTRLQQWF